MLASHAQGLLLQLQPADCRSQQVSMQHVLLHSKHGQLDLC